MFVGRVHKVNFNQRDDKHTVAFAKMATDMCEKPLLGLADPGNIKAKVGKTKGEVIEAIRQDLLRDIQMIYGADPKDFDFNVAMESLDDDGFYSGFHCVYGSRLWIHKENEGW